VAKGEKDAKIDRSKRSFFEILIRPMRAAVKGYELPVDHSSAKPPERLRVIRGGANAQVMAMLGPLARGEAAPGGYRLFTVQVDSERIAYVFERRGAMVNVRLGALDGAGGVAFGESATFRFVVDGDAPEADRIAVATRVLAEVKARDRGQLWVYAADTPVPPRAPAASPPTDEPAPAARKDPA